MSYNYINGVIFLANKKGGCVIADAKTGNKAYIGKTRFQGFETLVTWFGQRGREIVSKWIRENETYVADADRCHLYAIMRKVELEQRKSK